VKDEDELKKCKRELQELKTAFETEQKLQNDRFKMLQMFLNELLSGLYNSDTQQKKIDELSNMLYMCRYTGSTNRNTSIHRGRPTTRQGDECEKRIANIEYVLRMGTYHGENRIDKIENEIQKYREPIVVKTPPKREMTYDKSLRLGLNRQLYGV
jgi:di/tripeptidase